MTLLRTSTTDDSIVLTGEVDLATADEGGRAILAAAERGITVVDLSGVTFLDSSGLNMLLSAAQTLNGTGPLVVRRPSSAVRKVLEIALPQGAPGLLVADDPR